MAGDDVFAKLIAVIGIEGLDAVGKALNKYVKDLKATGKTAGDELGKQESRYQKWSKNVAKSVNSNVMAFRTAGRYLTVMGGALTAFFAKGAKEFIAYEKGLAEVSTMLAGTGEQVAGQMAIYDEGIRKLSVSFNQSTQTLTRGLYDILSASVAPAEALDVLATSSMAATAGLTDVRTAADAATTVMNSYAMAADNSGKVQDTLWGIVRRGKVTYEQIATTIGKVASIGAVAGLSFEEMAASIATATRAGVRYRIATTALNATILSFLKGSDESKAKAREFGFELDANTLKTIGLSGVIERLAGANDAHRKATAADIAVLFQNRRALRLVNPLLQQMEGFLYDVTYMSHAAGNSLVAFNKIAKTMDFQLGQLNKALNLLMIEAFEPLAPIVGGIADILFKFIEMMRQIPEPIRAAIVIFTALTGVLLTLSGLILLMIPGIAILLPKLAAIGIVVGSIVGAATIITGIAVAIKGSGDEARDAVPAIEKYSDTLDDIQEKFTNYLDFKTSVTELIERIKSLMATESELTAQGKDATSISRKLEQALAELADIAPNVAEAFDGTAGSIDDMEAAAADAIATIERLTEVQVEAQLNAAEAERIAAGKEAEEAAARLLKVEQDKLQASKNWLRFQKESAGMIEESEFIVKGMATSLSNGLTIVEDLTYNAAEAAAHAKKDYGELSALEDELTAKKDIYNKAIAREEALRKKLGELRDGELTDARTAVDIAAQEVFYKKALIDFENGVAQARGETIHTLDELQKKYEEAHAKAKEVFLDEMKDNDARQSAMTALGAAWEEYKESYDAAYEAEEDLLDETVDREIEHFGLRLENAVTYLKKKLAAEELNAAQTMAILDRISVYEQEIAVQHAQIWMDVNNTIKDSYTDLLVDLMDFSGDASDIFDNFADKIGNAFKEGFAKALVEKSGFDDIFKGNLLDLGSFVGNLGTTITTVFSNVFNTAGTAVESFASLFTGSSVGGGGLFSGFAGAGADAAVSLDGVTGASTGLATAITNTSGAISMTTGDLALMGGELEIVTNTAGEVINEVWVLKEGMFGLGEEVALTTGQMADLGIVVTEGGVQASASAAAFAEIGAVINAVAGPIAMGTLVINGLTQGLSKMDAALEGGEDSVMLFGAGLGNLVAPITSVLPDMGDFDDMLSSIAAGVAILGPGLGTLAGSFLAFGESLGIISHGKSWEENLADHIESALESGRTQEVIEFYFQTLFEDALMGDGGFTELIDITDGILSENLEARWAWYRKYVEGLGIFTEEQLQQMRDALQLYEDAEDRQEAAQRTALDIAKQQMERFTWQMMNEVPYLADALAGASGLLEDAWNQAIENGVTSVEGLRDIFEQLMIDSGEYSQEVIDRMLTVFDQSSSAFDLTQDLATAAGHFWEEFAGDIKNALDEAGVSITDFETNLERTMQFAIEKFADLNSIEMFFEGGWAQIEEWLKTIPGMTDDLVDKFMESIMENWDSIREFGFELGDNFAELVEEGINNVEPETSIFDNIFQNADDATDEVDDLADALQRTFQQAEDGADNATVSLDQFNQALEDAQKESKKTGQSLRESLEGTLRQLPEVTEEMIQQMLDMFDAGDWSIEYLISEEGYSELIDLLNAIPTEITTTVNVSENNENDTESVLDNILNGAKGTAGGRRGSSPVLDAVDSIVNGLTDLGVSPQIISPTPVGFKGGVADILPSSTEPLIINNKFVIEGGMIDDPIYWQKVVRDKVIPNIDDELSRYGKRLRG